YLGFLVLAVALVWLLPRLGVQRGRDGAVLAGGGGAVVWGALLLGLWSISTADAALLAAWWIGQTAELAVGGAVVGSILGGAPLRGVAWRVAGILVIGAVAAVVLQSIGYAPAPIVINR
ncbi:MAG: hypothetical protein ACXWL8_05415, partial [Candidatus Limnocylindria bacterium]